MHSRHDNLSRAATLIQVHQKLRLYGIVLLLAARCQDAVSPRSKTEFLQANLPVLSGKMWSDCLHKSCSVCGNNHECPGEKCCHNMHNTLPEKCVIHTVSFYKTNIASLTDNACAQGNMIRSHQTKTLRKFIPPTQNILVIIIRAETKRKSV